MVINKYVKEKKKKEQTNKNMNANQAVGNQPRRQPIKQPWLVIALNKNGSQGRSRVNTHLY